MNFQALGRQCVLLMLGSVLSAAAQAQPQLLACNISTAPPMAFGSYNPLKFLDVDAQTSLSVRCTGLGARFLRISLGPGLTGDVGNRALQRNGVKLYYGLYVNTGRTTAWGDGTAGTFVVQRLVFAGSEFTLPIYGRIPQRQNIPIGLYSDSVIVRLDF
jgi:spore coat protein U-like protein